MAFLGDQSVFGVGVMVVIGPAEAGGQAAFFGEPAKVCVDQVFRDLV